MRQARRTRESHQEGGNSQQRKSYGNLYGLTLATNNEAKDHAKLLRGARNLFLTPREKRIRKGVPRHKAMHSRTTNGNRTKTQRRTNNVPLCGQRSDEEDPPMETPTEEVIPEPWTLFTDGSSCLEGSGAGLILTSPEGEEITYALRFEFDASNNEAEYEALIAGLRIAEQIGVKNLEAKVDSCLVANQINGSYEAKEQSMIQYLEKAKALTDNFKMFSIEQVPQSENKKADALSKIASTGFAHLTKQYLAEGTIPADIKKARAIKIKARQYTMINGVLYRKSFLEPWLRCVGPTQAEYVLREIHEGSCSPFPEAQGKVRFLIVAIDCFTKWVEAKPVAMITGNQVRSLYGTTSYAGSDCQEKSYLTTESSSDRTHSKTGAKSLRSSKAKNDEGILLNLDMLEERREKASVREARSKAKMEKYYNARVRITTFCPVDFVYYSNKASHAKDNGKLGPK
ncbi:reverse transcriptase domain-containing protein [Tanacetum coccineum]|uniref:Reverse transcriptase domain-containing protein n=1 Tax=Tanacetum coccineum TaxID=301880 RepID=A0ABQ5HYC5_9ASTR